MTTAISTIIGAIVSGAASIIVCIVNNNKQNALMLFRLEQLEKKVQAHNNLIERMYRVEETNALQEEKLKALEKHVEHIEEALRREIA